MKPNPTLRYSLFILGTCILWFFLLRLPTDPVLPDLDPSWRLLLSLDLLHGTQAGKDLVFTYGPLGSLLTPQGPFVTEIHWLKVLAELIAKGLVALAFTRLILRMPSLWIQLLTFATLLVLIPWDFDSIYYLAITAACLTALVDKDKPYSGVFAAVLIAPLGLVKFTYAVMGLAGVCLLALGKAFQKKGLTSTFPPLALVLSFLLLWLGIGQSLGNLPLFIKGSIEISKGYNLSMFLMGDQDLLLIAVLGFASFMFWLLWAWWSGERNTTRSLQALLLLAPAFLCWKAGFVRQDWGHTLVFFSTLTLLPLWGLGLLVARSPQLRKRTLISVLAFLPLVLGVTGLNLASKRIGWKLEDTLLILRDTALRNRFSLLHPAIWTQHLVQKQKDEEQKNALPKMKALVGKGPADELPFTAAILYLNRIQTHHRPVFQSYSAYSPYLQDLNGSFFESKRSPPFVLIKPQEIDRKFPLQADSQSYRVLLQRYIPAASEKGWLLLKQKEDAKGLPKISGQSQGKLVASGEDLQNRWISLPEGPGMGELSVQLDSSMMGKIRAFLFRPPLMSMDIRRKSGTVQTYRSPPPSMRRPFLLDPPVTDTMGFLNLYLGENPDPVIAFRLHTRRGKEYAFAPRFKWSYFRVPFPSGEGIPEDLKAARWKLAFPLLPLPPLSMEPKKNFWNTTTDRMPVLLAHAKSRLVLQAPIGSYRFRASYGMVPGSYTGEGHTDGVRFRVSYTDGKGKQIILLDRRLEPGKKRRDQGVQKLDIPVKWKTRGRLILETFPGPTNFWDWSYWTQLSLTPRN